MPSLEETSILPPAERVRSRRGKREWVRGDVRCLACSRLMGRLLGTRAGLDFFAYKAVGPDTRVVSYAPGTPLHCDVCGGAGTVDDIEFLTTFDERPEAFAAELPRAHRRGPVPRPFKAYSAPAAMTIHAA